MTIITPPQRNSDLYKSLQKKLEEYKKRIIGKGLAWEHEDPQNAHRMYPGYKDALYKGRILRAVLETGDQFNTRALLLRIKDEYKEDFDETCFDNAISVIDGYCKGEEGLSGGTGLPEA